MSTALGTMSSADPVAQEAESLTTAQEIAAAGEAVKASGELAKAAGPFLQVPVQIFLSAMRSTPQLFAPAVQALLGAPFIPAPLKAQLRVIIAKGKAKAKAPPTRKPRSAPQAPYIPPPKKPFPTLAVLGGVAAVGIIATVAMQKRKK